MQQLNYGMLSLHALHGIAVTDRMFLVRHARRAFHRCVRAAVDDEALRFECAQLLAETTDAMRMREHANADGITPGLLVFVQLVIAASTTLPCFRTYFCPL